MRPRKVVLLLAPEWYGSGLQKLRQWELPVDVWGYRAVLSVAELGDTDPAAVVVCAPSVPHVVELVRPVLDRFPVAAMIVLGPFVGPEREALAAVGFTQVLPVDATAALLRETLQRATARKRGPQSTRIAKPCLAPLAVEMERAA